jgi:RNA polymerase sigma-70 factor (ECF subfamily)
LLRIGAHLALNHIRDNARFVGGDVDGGFEAWPDTSARGASGSAPERLEAAETAAELRDAVKGLPTKQRMTLELRIYEELPFRDIAVALGISEGAAKVNFHYAVRKLRSTLALADGDSQRGRDKR